MLSIRQLFSGHFSLSRAALTVDSRPADSSPLHPPSDPILTKWTENSGERDIGIMRLNPTISSNLTNGREWPASLNPQLSRRDDCFDWMRRRISAPHPTNTVFWSFSCRSPPLWSYTFFSSLRNSTPRKNTCDTEYKKKKKERRRKEI